MEIVPLADKKEFIVELAELHHAEWQHLNPSLTLEWRTEAIAKAAGREGIPSIFIAMSEGQLVKEFEAAALSMRAKLQAELGAGFEVIYEPIP